MTEKKNVKEFPKVFYCRHMLPGIARYENLNPETKQIDEEHLWIDADAMKRSAASMVGKPVYVQHQRVNLDTLKEDADGYVTDCFYNELDGWLWAKFLAITDAAQTAIARKWSVSNAYIPEDWEGGGSHLNVDYDKKIRKHNFTHLAIVPNPRYEEAKIYTPEEYKAYNSDKRAELDELQNSKPIWGHPMFKFFQKKDEELKNGIPADADLANIEIEINGKRVPLSEVANAANKNTNGDKKITIDEAIELYNAKKNEEEREMLDKQNKKSKWNESTEVCVGDEKMPMKDLMNKMGWSPKMNAEEEEAEKKKKKEEKENADKEKEKTEEKKKEEEKENAKRMKEMLNAHSKTSPKKIDTSMDKVKRGRDRY